MGQRDGAVPCLLNPYGSPQVRRNS